ncbi:MAG: riboflavin synthase [Flavobacteriales bacterium]|jgi:riboflavin synthase|nr:riboflavin synthase [Flavobacteriales bacterium]MBK7943155.1 riboflavin synthase [Flavobacteriales bacterium]MBK8947343.1 riboflavin synthase [Flavobacteriales bacterium]MBK9701792.1 riboflavin synthase [Flavobacteriales bacterium]
MFTGIVEEVGRVLAMRPEGGNVHFDIAARMTPELRVDQSVAHNGVCLTVVALVGDRYSVTAVKETLQRTTLGALRVGDGVDLERSLRLGDRLDGHLVQGHVDAVTACLDVREEAGSWRFTFALSPAHRHLVVAKGSICLNGVSLTVAELQPDRFAVAIIPYTYHHTVFHALRPGDAVNVEFDVLGKYVERMMEDRG